MRTTFDIDDDVLMVVKQIADQQQLSLGEVISQLVRQALWSLEGVGMRNGVPLFLGRTKGKVVTLAQVDQLRDELPPHFLCKSPPIC